MTKVFIHYFSGTGNTKRAVDLITDKLHQNGEQVTQYLIGKTKPIITETPDLTIVAFPVLSWSAPAFVKKYVKQLPHGNNAKAAVFAVYGGNPVQAVQNMEKLLNQKKYQVSFSGGACYPDNWTQMINPPAEAERPERLASGDQMVADFVANLIKSEKVLYRSNWLGNIITAMVSFLFSLIGRRFLGKTYIADSNCSQCGICVKICPVNTIKLAGVGRKRPFWKFNCEDCGRCINLCPKKAIQVSVLRLSLHSILNVALITFSFYVPKITASFLPKEYHLLGVIGSVVITILSGLWIQFTLIDRLFFLLESLPGFKQLFQWSYTKKFHRYSAPGFKPIKY